MFKLFTKSKQILHSYYDLNKIIKYLKQKNKNTKIKKKYIFNTITIFLTNEIKYINAK